MCILKNHKISNNVNVTFEIRLKINCEKCITIQAAKSEL
jgi:hypothetical protein